MKLFEDNITDPVTLADKYLMSPTTVLNTRDPKWQTLKRKWFSTGIQSELGRSFDYQKDINRMTNFAMNKTSKKAWSQTSNQTGISIFDPVLCEIMYKWFCPPAGVILDPFAGGSVRGVVAHKLGYKYTGVELSTIQVDSNRDQSLNILEVNNQPQWYVGDSDKIIPTLNIKADMIFSCPPYMGLEVYSDHPDDLSNMTDEDFNNKYLSIISKACDKLKIGGYAVFVVGDIRDNKGYYKDFTGYTKRCFIQCGMKLYNELILVNPVGSKALTMGIAMRSGKVSKVHQNVYVFVKA